MKKKIKIITDILMLVLFIYLIGYHPGMGLYAHAVCGIILFALFILHHILNISWFRALPRGRYNFRRILLTATDLLLLAAMILMAVSSVMISGLAFPFEWLPISFAWRDIHVCSSAWGFMLMAVHLALHLNGKLNSIERKSAAAGHALPARAAVYTAEFLLLAYGIYGFIRSGLAKSLLMIPYIKVPHSILFSYIEYGGIILGTAVLLHVILRLKDKKR